MQQSLLFNDFIVEEIRKQVLKEFERLPYESYDDYQEVVRCEVDWRLSQLAEKKRYYKVFDKRKFV